MGDVLAVAGDVLGDVGGSLITGNAIDKATSAQVNAGREAQANAQHWYDLAKENWNPYLEMGKTGLQGLADLNTDGSALAEDPGYQFRLKQGMEALQRSAASRGGLLSGGTLKGLTDYSQGAASQEYGNAWNRQMGLAQLGAGAASSLNGTGGQTSSLQNQNITGVGNAQAAGSIAQGNNWASTFRNAFGNIMSGVQ